MNSLVFDAVPGEAEVPSPGHRPGKDDKEDINRKKSRHLLALQASMTMHNMIHNT